MKRIINILFSVFTLLIISCSDDFLERNNPTATTDAKWWQLESDLRNYLEVIYVNSIPPGPLITGSTFQANCRMQMSGVTDECVFRGNFGSWQDFPLGSATASNGYVADMYSQNYRDIRNASRILENYKRVYIEDAVIKERYAAEARALRAYAHLKLFQFFGAVPIVSNSKSIEQAGALPRNTDEELVSFISSQLDSAASVLPVSYPVSEAYRMTKGTCYALQVQLYLQMKNYPKTIEYAKKIMDLNLYDLHYATSPSQNSYEQLFGYSALENKERILFRRTGSSGAFFRLAPKSLAGQATLSPTASMVNSYETLQGKTLQELGSDSLKIYRKDPLFNKNRDPRLGISVFFPYQVFVNRTLDPFNGTADPIGAAQSTQTGYWVRKYVDASDVSRANSGTLNFMVIRYAEVLLSYVEALVESGQWQNPDVALYLNKIRNRAKMPNFDPKVYNTQEKLRELYRRERKVELAFEGNRLFDIRRWRIGEEVLTGPAEGAINPVTNQPVVVETRVFDPQRDYLWPIPLIEMNGNNKMTQNPKW